MFAYFEFLTKIEPVLLSLLPVLVTVWLGYRLGLLTYFQKKEHEQIIHRYLEQGVDLLSANIDHALSVFRENWAHSLMLLREFRGAQSTGLPFREESYEEKFLKYEARSFSVIPFYKIKSLVGDDIFWKSGQLLFAFVGTAYDFFENDLKFAIQAFCKKNITTTPADKIYDGYIKEVWKLDEESKKFYFILMELQNLALFLETEPLLFKDLEKFKYRPEIKQSIRRLKDQLKEEMAIKEGANS